MEELTADELAEIFANASDSVSLINSQTEKRSHETDDEWKDRIKTNVEHLEIIKAYKKKSDGTTSVWTTEDFTAINSAITTGKAVYS